MHPARLRATAARHSLRLTVAALADNASLDLLPFTAPGCLALRINQQGPRRPDQEAQKRMNATQITTAGNLTSDPELRFTPSDKAVATFGSRSTTASAAARSGSMGSPASTT